MPEIDLETLNRILEGLAIVRTITDRNAQDIQALDARDKTAAEQNARRIQEQELKELEIYQALRNELVGIVNAASLTCNDHCEKCRKDCPMAREYEFIQDLKRSKWMTSKIGRTLWTLILLVLGAVLGGLFRELWALVFKV
jgi:CBS-domain-containing membrane protein